MLVRRTRLQQLSYLALALSMLVVSACASGYRNVLPGVNAIGQMQVTVEDGWQVAPKSLTPNARSTARTYTRDGLPTDRLDLIPGIYDGQALFSDDQSISTMPSFRTDMQSEEIKNLIETSLRNYYGAAGSSIVTGDSEENGFGGHAGIRFDISATLEDGQPYRGMVGAFVADERLYVIVFLAADPGSYEKYRESAEAVFDSVAIRIPTIRSG